MLLEVVLVEAEVGAPLGLVGIEAAALRHHLGAVALELGEVADRGVVERDGHAAELPLLPHLLVAADHGETEVFVRLAIARRARDDQQADLVAAYDPPLNRELVRKA